MCNACDPWFTMCLSDTRFASCTFKLVISGKFIHSRRPWLLVMVLIYLCSLTIQPRKLHIFIPWLMRSLVVIMLYIEMYHASFKRSCIWIIEEPHVNPQRSSNNDTRRDPCYFEHVNRRNTQRGTQPAGTTLEDQCDISQCNANICTCFQNRCCLTSRPWKDVIGDGNCGFRCMADFFFGDQAQWFTARETIANEVAAHPMLYGRIYGIRRVWMNAGRIRWEGRAVDSRIGW
ncbi:uncharacterized protein LOC110718855 [Chenopodium quinoa]|uniref:uncharacterized protein LOC110718855 n=1 Tax=Chenopodium quinoa TaxID=63459 RepID=UPI000B77BBAD|nr:uncharacterized protein LOC110718855 [Chenopodium quinoa]XP_021753468.1 uncharacterized protein LOC110718855 [Chenopodium quinoa]